MQGATDFQYRIPWRVTSCYAGSHHGTQRGGGYEIRGTAPLFAGGDPRRVDILASLRNPFGQLLVRVYKQRSIVPVIAIADVSASMSFTGKVSKYDLLIRFVNSLAYSAYRAGDPFAFTACDTDIREELSLPLTRARDAGSVVCERLRGWLPSGANASGLLAGAERVPGARALIFLLSDYHLPPDLLRAVLGRLSRHAVIPVVLVDSAEGRVPGTGIAHIYDSETRKRRTILLRRSLARRLEIDCRRRHENLARLLCDYNLRPLYLVDRFEPEDVSRYFYE